MFIRIGYEITLESRAEAVLILALSLHPSFEGRIIGSDAVRADRDLPLESFTDSFGNRLTRLHTPAGPLTLCWLRLLVWWRPRCGRSSECCINGSNRSAAASLPPFSNSP